MDEENKIKEPTQNVLPIKAGEEKKAEEILEEHEEKKQRLEIFIEVALFFILGILVGVALKSEAIKRFTIGFNDYKMKFTQQNYDINKLEEEVAKKQEAEVQNQIQDQAPVPAPNQSSNSNPAADNNVSN
ncbi:MAG: hypothetical protein NTZ97_04290 [Candidatus Moranbacteria bacterium]|nr:hypothetical protein [Candidatus Moranbacteria bacterium]